MAFVNFATREITAKIVYYGPGLGGKTTSLQCIHGSLPGENRGKMISLATEEDRTIYFDFLPLHLGKIQDFSVRVQLYTVPGQVRYNATRKLVLRGADGLVFVVDAQKHKKLANIESFHNLEENLREHGKDLRDLPHIIQINKVDLPNRMSTQELNLLLNKFNVPHFESCATKGAGVLESLKSITKLVFNDLGKKALLQKRNKPTAAAAAAAYPEHSFNAPASVASPPPPPAANYYGEAEYSSDLPHDSVVHSFKETYLPPEPVYEDRAAYSDSGSTNMVEAPIEISDVNGEVEPVVELEEPVAEEIPYENLLDDEASLSEKHFTYALLFEDTESMKELIERLELCVVSGDVHEGLLAARTAFSLLTTELLPRDYSMEANEALIMLALNVKFKRYLRFKQMLDSTHIDRHDLLFIHHFLLDLYLSLKEF